MKDIEKTMGLLMGVSLSFILTLTGLLSSGTFTILAFLSNFLISLLISTLVTKAIPLKKISSFLAECLHLRQGSLSYRLFDALISDLLMSPLMTFIMVSMAHKQATAHGAKIPFGPMLMKAELISFIVAYVALFFLSPFFLRIAMKKAGIDPQQAHN